MHTKRLILALLLLSAPLIRAQDSDKPGASQTAQPEQSFLLTLTLKVTDHGKLITDQTYSLAASDVKAKGVFTGSVLNEQHAPSIRDGNRYPITTETGGGKTEFQYVDVGTNIDFKDLRSLGSSVAMTINVENSSAIPDATLKGTPIIRNTRYSVSPVAPIGKQITIYSSNDPANGHKVEIQLLVQPLPIK
jgi:hypothetical protein